MPKSYNMRGSKWDIVLIGGILLIAISLYILIFYINTEQGAYAEVLVDGQVVGLFSLYEDTTYCIGDKDTYNILQIKNGAASVTAATCKDKICVNQRNIHNTGESIICLPHKMIIKVVKGNPSDLDSVVR